MNESRFDLSKREFDLLQTTFVRIAGYEHESVVDGEGIRTTIFFQGCKFNCKGCHNNSTHDLSGGKLVNLLEVYREIYESKLADGVTISGGEPLFNI